MYSLTGYQLYDIATVISRTGGLNIGSLYVRLSTEITCNQVTSVYSQVRRPGKTEGECSPIEISSKSNRMKQREASDRARSYPSTIMYKQYQGTTTKKTKQKKEARKNDFKLQFKT